MAQKSQSRYTAAFFETAYSRSVWYRPGVVMTVMGTFDEQRTVLRNYSGEAPTLLIQLELQPTHRQPLVIISPHDGASVSSTTFRVRYRAYTPAERLETNATASDGRRASKLAER